MLKHWKDMKSFLEKESSAKIIGSNECHPSYSIKYMIIWPIAHQIIQLPISVSVLKRLSKALETCGNKIGFFHYFYNGWVMKQRQSRLNIMKEKKEKLPIILGNSWPYRQTRLSRNQIYHCVYRSNLAF